MSFDRKYPTPNFFDRHYEGQDFENLNRVPVCTKDFEIRVESPTTLEVGKSEMILARLNNKKTGTSIEMPLSIMRIVNVDNPGIVSVRNGRITGLKEGTATLRVIRLLTDLDGIVFESNIRTTFTVTVQPMKMPEGVPFVSNIEAYFYIRESYGIEWFGMYFAITVTNNTDMDLRSIYGTVAIRLTTDGREYTWSPFIETVIDIDDKDSYWNSKFSFLSGYGSSLKPGESYTLKSAVGNDMWSEDYINGPLGWGGFGALWYHRGNTSAEIVAEISHHYHSSNSDSRTDIPESDRTRVTSQCEIYIPHE